MGSQHDEYDPYARYWDWAAQQCRHQQHGLCCFPGCDRAIWQVHHAVYQELNEWGQLVPVRGHEQPGVHIFGLCKCHHGNARIPKANHKDAAHYCKNWVGNVPKLDRRNTPEYYKLLVSGFREKVCGLAKPFS